MTKKKTTNPPKAQADADEPPVLSYELEEDNVATVRLMTTPTWRGQFDTGDHSPDILFLELLEKAIHDGRFHANHERRGMYYDVTSVRPLPDGSFEFQLKG